MMKLKSIWLTLILALIATPAFAEDVLDTGNTAWMIVATALVMMMTPAGLALFYGGMSRYKNLLTPGHDLCLLLPGQCYLDDVGLHPGLRLKQRRHHRAFFHERHRRGQPVRQYSYVLSTSSPCFK